MSERRVRLTIEGDDGALVTLRAERPLEPAAHARALRYETRTGAIVRVDGRTCGAFDRDHPEVIVPAGAHGNVTLEVEHRSIPVRGLPWGDGARWRRMLARAAQIPATTLGVARVRSNGASPRSASDLALVGHSHLDVAWLWTYEEAARKAVRTFATAVKQLEADPHFVFAQSQPQLYAFVRERDPELFERIRALARAGRIDTSVAALWVEPDCNVPSGESLLRQAIAGIRFVEREFGTTPSVAWLPDTFGFAITLPAIFAHAGIAHFATTKLGWNDTTTFPYARFRWEGPDGSSLVAASIASIEGAFARRRVARARERGDLLLVGRGDGGGGAEDRAVARAARFGRWTTVAAWFGGFDRAALPVWRDELYLETHRGVLTTHHDVKARNAALERALGRAETALAWARALHASPFFLDEARAQLERAWEIVLRAQFHDVLPGTSIAAVYRDVHAEYDRADALVAHVAAGASSVLPVGARDRTPVLAAPRRERGGYVFENEFLAARVRRDGTFDVLRTARGPARVRTAHRLVRSVDRPARWDAWNVDRAYRRHRRTVRVTGCAEVDGGLEVRYAFGKTLGVARYTLAADEPFVRVEMAVDWQERHEIVRLEAHFAGIARRARFGAPHGVVERATEPRSRVERAKFEACGQRYARLDSADGGGLAVLSLDTYGWSLDVARGASVLGHSLLRGPAWPDPAADRGEHAFSLAYLPFDELGMGELEHAWQRFAGAADVPMFACDDAAIVVVATMLSNDGNAAIVRARECDGIARDVVLRCGARARTVESVDALERPVDRTVRLEDGALVARFEPYELRTFAVRLA